MAKALLVGIIVVLIVTITILIIATLWMRSDFIECENTESPWCPQFTCPSGTGCTGDLSPNDNCGKGMPASRQSNPNQKAS